MHGFITLSDVTAYDKPIYHAQNINRWKGSVKPRPFIGLLILDVINQFILVMG